MLDLAFVPLEVAEMRLVEWRDVGHGRLFATIRTKPEVFLADADVGTKDDAVLVAIKESPYAIARMATELANSRRCVDPDVGVGIEHPADAVELFRGVAEVHCDERRTRVCSKQALGGVDKRRPRGHLAAVRVGPRRVRLQLVPAFVARVERQPKRFRISHMYRHGDSKLRGGVPQWCQTRIVRHHQTAIRSGRPQTERLADLDAPKSMLRDRVPQPSDLALGPTRIAEFAPIWVEEVDDRAAELARQQITGEPLHTAASSRAAAEVDERLDALCRHDRPQPIEPIDREVRVEVDDRRAHPTDAVGRGDRAWGQLGTCAQGRSVLRRRDRSSRRFAGRGRRLFARTG